MKQNISVKQLDELSEKGKKRLRKWFENTYKRDPIFKYKGKKFIDCTAFLSIGQMIEFLGDNKIDNWHPIDRCHETKGAKGWHVVMGTGELYKEGMTYEADELCDALWQVVKEILEK